MFDNGQPPQPWNPQTAFDQNTNNMTDRLAQNERRIGDELSDALNAYGGTSRGGRSHQSAGAHTIAEGAAAQNMVGGMQHQAFLNRGKQQAQAAMNPRFNYTK